MNFGNTTFDSIDICIGSKSNMLQYGNDFKEIRRIRNFDAKYQKNEWYIFQNIKSYQNIFKLNIEAILELLITVTHLGAAHNQRNRKQETENKNFK